MIEDNEYTGFIGKKLNYFGHELFISRQLSIKYTGSHMYECKKCNITANCYTDGGRNYYYYKNEISSWHKIDLTCDEFIIKRLLE